MDIEWVAIALGDVVWILVAFGFGLFSRSIGLPPLVGYLAAGFALHMQGAESSDALQKLSDLGITLLLFTVGLKLRPKTLARPQVWGVAIIHTAITTVLFAAAILLIAALLGAGATPVPDIRSALLIAFAFSFSSTVFAVKTLEERGEMMSMYGQVAIGILIMQDMAAVIFMAFSTGTSPSIWSLLLPAVLLLRTPVAKLLELVGHGELMVLFGFLMALGGAEVFELVGLKGDLGALAAGIIVAQHPKADELSKSMLGFKDLFLLGFFLTIGLSTQPSWNAVFLGAAITALVAVKTVLFFALMTTFRLRARTAFLASMMLGNYSEFGLIVAAISVANGWISSDWIIVIAIAMSLSFAAAAVLNRFAGTTYARYREFWRRFQIGRRLSDDQLFEFGDARIAVVGMGGIGTGAYDRLKKMFEERIVGIDIDPTTAESHRASNRNVLVGDPGDADFWDRVEENHHIAVVLIALPKLLASIGVIRELKSIHPDATVAAIARFPDEEVQLEEAGADIVFNVYAEAGRGYAAHVVESMAAERVGR